MGALLVAAVYVLPGAAARLVAVIDPGAAGGGAGAARPRRGVAGLYAAYWLDLPPGPPVAVLGALVYAALALAVRPAL